MCCGCKEVRRQSPLAALAVSSALAFLAIIGAARAQEICTNVNYLIDQSLSKFAKIAVEADEEDGDHDVTLSLSGTSYCFVTKKSSRTWYHCGWEFPHRTQRAYDRFDEFVGRLDDCIGQHATAHTDQKVNHPDFYALRRYEMEQADVSVSVKDKSALGKTFVFIKVQSSERE